MLNGAKIYFAFLLHVATLFSDISSDKNAVAVVTWREHDREIIDIKWMKTDFDSRL